jgi:sugar phosphate isomerase/epimerase
MELKLSCADYTFPLLPHNHVLELITMLDFQAVDIGLFGGRSHVRPEVVLEDIPHSARKLTKNVEDHGLEIVTIFLIPREQDALSLATNNPDANRRQEARDLFMKTLDFVNECGVSHLSAGAGVRWRDEPEDVSFERDAEELGWRVQLAQKAGVTFAIEPHANSLAATPDDTLRLIEMTPGLTLALDYAHFIRHGIPEREVHPLLEYTSNFHARGANAERLQASFKDNTVDFEQILSILKSHNYPGYICLEYVWTEWERCNEVDNLSETILLRDFIRGVDL